MKSGSGAFNIFGLIFCVFMGYTGVSLGFGAAYPPLNLVAKPFVCSNGEMQYQQKSINPLPGRTYTMARWQCTDSSGNSAPVSNAHIAVYSGLIYGTGLFVLLQLLMIFRGRS